MEKIVYDIECYPNYFLLVPMIAGTNEWYRFEIRTGRNDIPQIIKFFKNRRCLLITFNGNHYDNVLLHYIFRERKMLMSISNSKVCALLKKVSDTIIRDENWYLKLKKYKYPSNELPYTSVDLYLYWSKLIRINKSVSLKHMQHATKHPNLQELPIRHTKLLEIDEMHELATYCKNDVDATYRLAKEMWPDIQLRRKIAIRFGLKNATSMDSVKIGMEILKKKYLQHVPVDPKVFDDMRTSYPGTIKIKDLLLPFLEFKDPKLKGVLAYFKKTEVLDQKGQKVGTSVIFKGVKYQFGLGGLHSKDRAEIIRPSKGELLKACDATSYYPNQIIQHGFKPSHLEQAFIDDYRDMYEDRVEAKKIEENPNSTAKEKADAQTDNSTYKLALNGFTGNLKNKYSWANDSAANLSITINGQLMLLMLAEWFEEEGIKIVSGNTDGLEVKVKEEKLSVYMDICERWQDLTSIPLEHDEYKVIVRRDVNNYLAVYKSGKHKAKGMFKSSPPLEDSHSFLAEPKAILNHFLKDVPIEDEILNNNDIYDFCDAPRVAKKYKMHLGDTELSQRLNRVFISTQGKPMFLLDTETGVRSAIFKGFSMEVMNIYDETAINRVNKKVHIQRLYTLLSKFNDQNLFSNG